MIPTHEMDAARLGSPRFDADLAERIEGHIERRACGRIRDLHVVCTDDGVVLHGRSRTYHAKQLAQQAACDVTGRDAVLTNCIVVS